MPPSDPSTKSKNPGQHIWKASWYYDENTASFKPAKHCDSIVNEIVGQKAEDLVKIYNSYKK